MDIIDRVIEKFVASFNPEISEAELDEFKQQLRQEEGGQKHYAYSLAASKAVSRDRAVFKLMQQGLKTADIAERLGVSQRWVQQIIARTPLA